MAIIGTLKLGTDGVFSGELSILTAQRKLRLVPNDTTNDKAPDYRVFSGVGEIAAAWRKSSQKGDTYYAVKFDDPTLPAPFWAALVESTKDNGQIATWNLLWDRQKPSES